SIRSHTAQMQLLFEKLIDAGGEITEAQQIDYMINSVRVANPDWKNYCEFFKTTPVDQRTLSRLITHLHDQESINKNIQNLKTKNFERTFDNFSSNKRFKADRQQVNEVQNKNLQVCKFCKKKGYHLAKNCWMNPKNTKKSGKSNSERVTKIKGSDVLMVGGVRYKKISEPDVEEDSDVNMVTNEAI
ncbi:hypothetical protein HDU92_000924, partial [Lobulomyces angularis]